jgi:hypothetical protein
VIDASTELAEYLGEDTDSLSLASVEELFIRIVILNTLEVPTSVLDSIIASGQIRLIENSEIRKALAEWPVFSFGCKGKSRVASCGIRRISGPLFGAISTHS